MILRSGETGCAACVSNGRPNLTNMDTRIVRTIAQTRAERNQAKMALNEHPGYMVVEDSYKRFVPIKLHGGLGTSWSDDKGRHPSGITLHFYRDGEKDVAGELFYDVNGRELTFDNLPHAENFLNKWVREQIGYQRAWDAWEKYQAEEALKEETRNKQANVAPIVDRLLAERDRYLTLSRSFEFAAELVKAVNAGELREDHALTVFKMVTEQTTHQELKDLYTGLIEELGLE